MNRATRWKFPDATAIAEMLRRLTTKFKTWLNAPRPITNDLKWWAPQWRLGIVASLALVALAFLGGGLFVRSLDSDYDDPGKFEQVYYLNDIFTLRKDAVPFESNIFGDAADPRLEMRAKLLRLHGANGKAASLDTLIKKHIALAPLEILPDNPAVKLEKLDRHPHLRAALQEMAIAGLVRHTPATAKHGAVYSFDLEMEVFRGKESLGLYQETFHFRSDAIVEQSTVLLTLLFAGLTVLFIVDFSSFVMDVRWGKYFKAVAMELAQVLHYLKYPVLVATEFWDLQPVMSMMVDFVLKGIVEKLLAQLERLIAVSDHKEVRALHREAQELLVLINTNAGKTLASEADLLLWQQKLHEVIKKTESIQQRLQFLGARSLRFHYHKPPLTLLEKDEAAEQAKRILEQGFEEFRTTLAQLNSRRSARRRQHLAAKAQRSAEIATRLVEVLSQEKIKSFMKKLGENFSIESTTHVVFEDDNVRAEGKTRTIGKREYRYYSEFYYAVDVSLDAPRELLWVEISKRESGYELAAGAANQELEIASPPCTRVSALNAKDEATPISYTIAFKPHAPQADKDTLQFQLTAADIDLHDPTPDPEPWFEEYPPIQRIAAGH